MKIVLIFYKTSINTEDCEYKRCANEKKWGCLRLVCQFIIFVSQWKKTQNQINLLSLNVLDNFPHNERIKSKRGKTQDTNYGDIYVLPSAIACLLKRQMTRKVSFERRRERKREREREREREKEGEGESYRILLFKLDDFAKRGELANFVFMLPLDGAGENRDKSPPHFYCTRLRGYISSIAVGIRERS